MILEILFGGIFAFFLLSGGTKLKNTVEDDVTAASDSFTAYDALFQKYALQNTIQWQMLKAICMNESSLGTASSVARGLANPDDVDGSKSSDGKSWGLMQMTIPTARDYDPAATAQKLNNPEYSIDLAAQFISDLQGQFPGNDEFIVKSYNQGAGNSRKEMAGTIDGYAQSYWERYTRNRALIQTKQGV